MIRHGLAEVGIILGLGLSCALSAGQTQEMVYRKVTSAKLEALLKELNVSYQKTAGKKGDIFVYDFERKGNKVRLYNYGGDDLWIEADFTQKLTLDDVNRWNTRAKNSRAVLVKDGASATISLEAQIDCTLGVTLGMIREFVRRFDDEVQAFAKFIKK